MDLFNPFLDPLFIAYLILGGVGSWLQAILNLIFSITNHEIRELKSQGKCSIAVSMGKFVTKLQMIGTICMMFHAVLVIFAMILIVISQDRNDKKYQRACVGVLVSFVCLSLGGALFLISLVYMSEYRVALLNCL